MTITREERIRRRYRRFMPKKPKVPKRPQVFKPKKRRDTPVPSRITGPFSKTPYSNAGGFFRQTWYRQVRPRIKPLAYTADRAWGEVGASFWAYSPVDSPARGPANVQAYERFINRVKPSESQLAVTLLEYHQGMNMIYKRSIQLAAFVKAVNEFRFVTAARLLGSQVPEVFRGYWRRPSRDLGKNILEYHFGWAPLVQDIGNAVETLQRGIPPLKVRASARSTYSSKSDSGSYTGTIFWGQHEERKDIYKTALHSKVIVENPNLALANQLGFTNPASVAWEIIPYSFLVDWFLPVGRFLKTWNNLAGYKLVDPHTSVKARTDYEFYYYNSRDGIYRYNDKKARFVFRRTLGLTTPTLSDFVDVVDLKLTPWRAATAVALLLQRFKGN